MEQTVNSAPVVSSVVAAGARVVVLFEQGQERPARFLKDGRSNGAFRVVGTTVVPNGDGHDVNEIPEPQPEVVGKVRELVRGERADCVAVECRPLNGGCSCQMWRPHVDVPVVPLMVLFPRAARRFPFNCEGAADLARALQGAENSLYLRRFKPVLDKLLVLLLLPVAAPLCLVGALLVKLTSRGPVLYAQERVGFMGRRFTMSKLRTMVHGAEKKTGPVWSPRGDDRVTPLGRLWRRFYVDELPQLWSVLKGDMSLVGPRPERPCFVEDLAPSIPHYDKRLLVRPGLTGWAQIHRGSDHSVDDVRDKLSYDLYYVRHASLALDLRTLWLTTLQVLRLKR